MIRMAGVSHWMRLRWSLILLSLAAFFFVTVVVGSVDGQKCEDTGGVSPMCQVTDCGVYCMMEIPEGNYDCQSRRDYPKTAKCCDYMYCDVREACWGSITVDQFGRPGNGGECIYSNSEDTYDFVCPNGWTHMPIGDKDCQQGAGGYQGSFMSAMCCCAPTADTCNGRPPDYQPDYVYGTRGSLSLQDTDTPWYAVINITAKGALDFKTSRGFNIEHDILQGVRAWRGFVRYVEVCNDGRYACGLITENGPEFSQAYCDVNDRDNVYERQTAIDIFYVPECDIGGAEDEPRRYTVLMKVDRVYEDGRLAPQFLNFTVVPGVYTVIGVFDKQLVDVRWRIAMLYERCRNTPSSCSQSIPTEEAYYDYCHYYVLARSCDMPFLANMSTKCKNVRMEGGDIYKYYEQQVDEADFRKCPWEIIDSGKYHDYPGVYMAVMNKSRHGANIGLLNYYVNSLNPRGSTHIVNPTEVPMYQNENIESALNWNQKSAGRILGCRTDSDAFWSDKCGPGNFTCSLGAALAYAYKVGFRSPASKLSEKCGYFEWEQPPTSEVAGQRADYFQWNDNDDEDMYHEGDPFNPFEGSLYYTLGGGLERYDDKAFDFEMGIPDRRYIVNESIESIRTNITARFVKYDSVEWNGLDYRLAIRAYTCEEGASWSRKYFRIPWGRGEGDDFEWENGNWPGGTTYEYVNRSGGYNYSDYPAASKWAPGGAWYTQDRVNNPIIYWPIDPRPTTYDIPAATDRYWFVSPKTPESQSDTPLIEATRPAHQGVGNPGGVEPLYYHNPGGYMKPGDSPRINPFNEGATKTLLSYYRQFNKRMLWANVFKVTPEFHNIEPREVCEPETENVGNLLGIGKGDCNVQECASGHCDSTLLGVGFCCPAGTTWDLTRECCIKCGVPTAKLYDFDYCRRKNELECECEKEEGGCENDKQCEDGLKCVDNPYVTPLVYKSADDACCRKIDDKTWEVWNGYACIPPDSITQNAPIYTRTGGNAEHERGGGPIWFHFAAGGNLPTENESGGNWDATEYCHEELGGSTGECGTWSTINWGYGNSKPLNSFFNQDICTKAWTYMRDQGGIWDEQKNLGYDRITWEDVKARVKAETGQTDVWGMNPEGAAWCDVIGSSDSSIGYWCSSAEGCNCHPNEASRRGPGPWAVSLHPPQDSISDGWYDYNPYWACEAALDGDDSGVPASCGKTCRKMLMKDDYRQPVKAWFDYAIAENGGPGKAGSMEGGENVLPLEAPWNFLHAGAYLLEHSLNDKTTSFMIGIKYTAYHQILRMPLAQTCYWEGCSVHQLCSYYRELRICSDGWISDENHRCPSPCGECELAFQYICDLYGPDHEVCDEYDTLGNCVKSHWQKDCLEDHYERIPNTGITYFDPAHGMCTWQYWWKMCNRCWGSWKHGACDYPVSNETNIMYEYIEDTSSVVARPYGSHLITSRPLGMENAHTKIIVGGYLDYQWGGDESDMDYRGYRINGMLNISSIGVVDGRDLLGGFELIVPDAVKVSFVAKDYPPIHELYMLDSTASRVKIFINPKMQDMMYIQRCGDPQTAYSYFHYVTNPLKKYFYMAQGIVNDETKARAFFSALGDVYTWDVTLHCRGGFFKDPYKQYVGIFRNFHEDEAHYWDLVGFYPQRKDLGTVETSLTDKGPSESETFTSKKTPEEESQIDSSIVYDKRMQEYEFNFSTHSISSDDMEDSTLRVYSDFRHIEVHPFKEEAGAALSCSHDHITEKVGSIQKDVYMRHPVELSVSGVDASDSVIITISGTDTCTGGGVNKDEGRVLVNFQLPYTDYSGMYNIGDSIKVEKRSRTITMTAEYMGFGRRYQPSIKELEVKADYKNILDYIFENIPVILIAFLALMSYRFYNSKRMDLQEMWDEWKGKK